MTELFGCCIYSRTSCAVTTRHLANPTIGFLGVGWVTEAMSMRQHILRGVAVGFLLSPAAAVANATGYAFSSYGLGGNAFGAGVTPPPGTYVTSASAFYSGKIGRTLDFGGVVLNAGVNFDGYSSAQNILYVPETKILGGNL
jgi:hypothetical protein